MRTLALLLLVGVLVAGEASPAPATVITTEGRGPSAGARTTEITLAVDHAWAAARRQAELQAQARRAAAANATAIANTTRGIEAESQPLTPGGLATLAGQDEVAMLLELQRRRRMASGDQTGNLLAAELAATLSNISANLPSTNRTPSENGTVAHPGDEPHPGPRAPTVTDAADRPEQLPAR